MLPTWKSGDLRTCNHGNLEIWISTNLQTWKINAPQPGGPQGAGGYSRVVYVGQYTYPAGVIKNGNEKGVYIRWPLVGHQAVEH